MTRAYRVVARLKNNRLWEAVLAEWPDVTSQADAARRLGITANDFGRLLNMNWWPYSVKNERWYVIAQRVADRLHETPEYLFDGELYGKTPQALDFAIDRPALESRGLLSFPLPTDEVVERDRLLPEAIQKALSTLTPREQDVLTRSMFDEEDFSDIGKSMNVSRERVRQISNKALRRLRHPSRAKYLNPYVGGDG